MLHLHKNSVTPHPMVCVVDKSRQAECSSCLAEVAVKVTHSHQPSRSLVLGLHVNMVDKTNSEQVSACCRSMNDAVGQRPKPTRSE
jgi:hypothetical protein